MRQSKWYIKIDGKKEGPYTLEDLRNHPFVTPFTEARKKTAYKGAKWRMMGQIPELKGLFQKTSPVEGVKKDERRISDVLVSATDSYMGSMLVWSVIALLVILFIVFTFTNHGR